MRIRIIEECFGIDRRTGERSSRQTDDKSEDAVVGAVIEMPNGRRRFTIDTVSETSVAVSVCNLNNPAVSKTIDVSKGESVVHRPRTMDGGYKYIISVDD